MSLSPVCLQLGPEQRMPEHGATGHDSLKHEPAPSTFQARSSPGLSWFLDKDGSSQEVPKGGRSDRR